MAFCIKSKGHSQFITWIRLFPNHGIECVKHHLIPLHSLSDSITINHKDSRWVGAWWLGFLVTGTVILLSSIPFWFLPRSLPKQGQKKSQSKSTELTTVAEQENFLPDENLDHEGKEKSHTFQELAKGIKNLQALR